MGTFLFLISTLLVAIDVPQNGNAAINKNSYSMIKLGMKEADVERILGGKFGSHFDGRVFFITENVLHPEMIFYGKRLERDAVLVSWNERNSQLSCSKGWIGNHWGIWVGFSKDGVVLCKGIHPVKTIND